MNKSLSSIKGLLFEQWISKLHSEKLALLVSPLYLRRIGAGQIDIAYFDKFRGEMVIKVIESKLTGAISNRQKIRLKMTRKLLGELFNMNVLFELRSSFSK